MKVKYEVQIDGNSITGHKRQKSQIELLIFLNSSINTAKNCIYIKKKKKLRMCL